jgi:PAP2 superfamily
MRDLVNFLRRRLDETVTVVFLLLVLIFTILRPPIFATAGGLMLAHIVLWGAGILLAILLAAARFSRMARNLRDIVLQIGPMMVAIVGYASLRLLHAEDITAWLGIRPKDRLMMAADIALFGKTPYLWFAQWGHNGHLFQRVMASFYALYPLTPVIALAWFLYKGDGEQFRLIRRTLLISFYCGYCCYILIPVGGPLSIMNLSPLYIQSTTTYAFLMENFRYRYDCFPSLHTANPWLLIWLCRGKIPRALMTSAIVAACGITISTITLRQHFAIDDLAGLAWVFLIAPVARATLPRKQDS